LARQYIPVIAVGPGDLPHAWHNVQRIRAAFQIKVIVGNNALAGIILLKHSSIDKNAERDGKDTSDVRAPGSSEVGTGRALVTCRSLGSHKAISTGKTLRAIVAAWTVNAVRPC